MVSVKVGSIIKCNSTHYFVVSPGEINKTQGDHDLNEINAWGITRKGNYDIRLVSPQNEILSTTIME